MAGSKFQLLIELMGKDRGAKAAMRGVSKEVTGLERQTKALTNALAGLGVMGMAYMGKQAAQAAWNLGTLGAEALRTEAAFDRLAGRIGETGNSLANHHAACI